MTRADVRTLIRGAIAGDLSPFHNDGKAIAFKKYFEGQPVNDVPWKYFHPVHTKERLKAERKQNGKNRGSGSIGRDTSSTSWTMAEDLLTGLIKTLISKVSR